MSNRLEVELFGRPAGTIAISGPLRSPEDWTFAYREDYLASANPVALSVSLPLRREPHAGAAVRNWFCNLLPEGAVREAVVARLRIPDRDDFALLAAIGGECAGAVSIRTPDAAPVRLQDEETDLETLLYLQGEDAGEGSWALVGTPLRLSLAGAQDKIAVIVEPDGRLRLPRLGESSTHILKPDSRRFRGLRDLEALGLTLARAIGLDAAYVVPIEVANRPALLIERYDRKTDPEGDTQRLHQEDFCQALGYPSELKYEVQGGPGLLACSRLVRQLGLGPIAVQGLLDWVAFNALIGNADAHAKNLALLCDNNGRRQLAPFYDLVPTLALPESLIDRTPALRIGEARRIDDISADDWRAFASQAGYGSRFVLRRVVELADATLNHLSTSAASIVQHGGGEARVKRAAHTIAENARRTRDRIAGPTAN
ncbi:type II toxin-antitoxin system HipA family toxin [Pseudoxanthomonas sp. X-1]|uniref:type II toxin-antitoxin system HipA family toxin n=1 Tax=Pseudoxanthomonas sp. X-1 TaxID=2571115 RepID=UPI00110A09E2|nr:type II toxin-antitoxin system HipA family toxin [Pseudoxanthomonas sp. X-1]TMN24162.1 type II toxin-antitoxin system HipA family toxin [Pseudoxanthomonas sp. X-1]UAY75127.1 type II toxin-antitoxin system HipA family toxin [Pseudoxanthomonas sp. X-1]